MKKTVTKGAKGNVAKNNKEPEAESPQDEEEEEYSGSYYEDSDEEAEKPDFRP